MNSDDDSGMLDPIKDPNTELMVDPTIESESGSNDADEARPNDAGVETEEGSNFDEDTADAGAEADKEAEEKKEKKEEEGE